MGTVYRATARGSRRPLAIKVVHGHLVDTVNVRRLLGEVVAALRIDHPAIVRVKDYGLTRCGRAYFVMEYVEGVSVAAFLDDGPLPIPIACRFVRETAHALACAHRVGIVHRDVKPANILVTRARSGPLIRLIDFGIAKFIDGDGLNSHATASGVMLGTPAYMSPEQCIGDELDHRTDIYSLGCVLYELITGTKPFTGTPGAVLLAHRTMLPVPPQDINPAVPDELETLVFDMLEKRQHERVQSIADFLARLSQVSVDDYW